MKKFKLKSFLIVFFVLMVIEFLIVLADVFLHRSKDDLAAVTSNTISVFSLPINLINRNLPFYVAEDLYMRFVFWTINTLIQAIFVYGFIVIVRRLKNREKLKF